MPYKYLHLYPWKVVLMFSSLIPIDGTKYHQRLEMIVVEGSTLALEDGKEALSVGFIDLAWDDDAYTSWRQRDLLAQWITYVER